MKNVEPKRRRLHKLDDYEAGQEDCTAPLYPLSLPAKDVTYKYQPEIIFRHNP